MRTFLDSGVLITAWKRGNGHARAISLMADEQREFFTCENVKLEVLPKPFFEKRRTEADFYNQHFSESTSEDFSSELGRAALLLAKRYGLAAGDALNLASAIRQDAEEFFTSELPGKPMFRVKELRVISIHE